MIKAKFNKNSWQELVPTINFKNKVVIYLTPFNYVSQNKLEQFQELEVDAGVYYNPDLDLIGIKCHSIAVAELFCRIVDNDKITFISSNYQGLSAVATKKLQKLQKIAGMLL